jgi:hypothetical protein
LKEEAEIQAVERKRCRRQQQQEGSSNRKAAAR